MTTVPLSPGPFVPQDPDGSYRCIACRWPLEPMPLEPRTPGIEATALICTNGDCNQAFIIEHRDGVVLDAGWGEMEPIES
jgi:hypothetical protein